MEGSILAIMLSIVDIAFIDLTLSGDNAAVIGMAIRNLDRERARTAALIGAGLAVGLRIFLTAIATSLTKIPYLGALGSLLLAVITWRLLTQRDEEHQSQSKTNSFWGAVASIVIADLSMALDNVLAVAGRAEGSVMLVVLGLALSIPILIWGSTYIAVLMTRHPIILYIGAAILAKTSAAMLLQDKALGLSTRLGGHVSIIIEWIFFCVVAFYGIWAVRERSEDERASDHGARNG